MTGDDFNDCVEQGLAIRAAEPDSLAWKNFCQDDDHRCPMHQKEQQLVEVSAMAEALRKTASRITKKAGIQKPVDAARGDTVRIIGGKVCYNDEIVVIDGIMRVKALLKTPRGNMIRMAIQRDEHSDITMADMRPDVMEQPALWNAWLTKHGGLNGRIDKRTRQPLKDWVFKQIDAIPVAHYVSHVGYIEEWDVLAFADGWIDARGVLRRTMDEASGTELVVGGPGNGTGSTRVLYVQASDFGADTPRIPYIVDTSLMDESYISSEKGPVYHGPRMRAQEDARDAIRRMIDAGYANYGTHAIAIGLGYMMAHAVSAHLFKHFDRFPHLFVTGPYQCGKDTFARFIIDATCGARNAAIKAGDGTTPKLVRNALGKNSLHPLWVNEIRGGKSEEYLDSFIRAAYDRQGSAITNVEQERVDFPVRRSFMLVGEKVSGADAEFSRYVELHLKDVANPEHRQALEDSIRDAKSAWIALLADWHRAAPAILESVSAARGGLMRCGIDERRAYAWACVLGGLSWLMAPAAHDPQSVLPESLWREVMERIAAASVRSRGDGAFSRFWEAAGLARRKEMLLQTDEDRWVWLHGDDKRQMALAANKLIFRTEDALRARMPDAGLVKNEMVRLPCFIGQKDILVTHGGKKQRLAVMLFDLTHPGIEDAFPAWVIETAYKGPGGVLDEDAMDRNRDEREARDGARRQQA